MPTYEYACSACGHEWEQSQRITEAPIEVCVRCSKPTAHRLISGGTNFILKGGGWYSDLYSSSKSASKSEEKGASGKSEGGSESKGDKGSETKADSSSSGGSDTSGGKGSGKAASADGAKTPASSASSS